MSRTFIIAEAGVNHNGDQELAKRLVVAAAQAGADAVKFQSFRASLLVTGRAAKAGYQQVTTGAGETQQAMLARLELPAAAQVELAALCQDQGIVFLSSAFDLASLRLLADLGVTIFKIPSGEITNLPYLRAAGALGRRMLLSTGMADLGEIEDAIEILTAAGTDRAAITLLHCHTEYPTAMADANLRAMVTMAAAFGLPVGYSDHTQGLECAVAAVALGARVLEKHFTLDRGLPGPDHRASVEPAEFASLVAAIRNVEVALGDGRKRPTEAELRNLPLVRKSIVASRAIRAGEILSPDNLTCKRPGTGLSPMRWDEVIGRPARREFAADEPIEL
ncbi:MAG: N-acetylneuraminate synthase [Thermodesulfobacteriota bacterium]